MKLSTTLLFVCLGLVSGCAENRSAAKRPAAKHPAAVTDDRQYNIQSRSFETRDQATGLEVTRRYSAAER